MHPQQAVAEKLAELGPVTEENGAERIGAVMWWCIDRLGEAPRTMVDPRTWDHLMVYRRRGETLPAPWWVDDRRASGGALQIMARHAGEGSSYCVASMNIYENPEANAALIVSAVNKALAGPPRSQCAPP